MVPFITFSTMTGELLKMGDWLADKQVTHVAMESTGEYWKPVYNLLEDRAHGLRPQQKDEKVIFSSLAGREVEVSEVL